MTLEIPDSVRQKASRCPHEFGCLATGRCGEREICEVEYAYGESVMLLASKPQVGCSYGITFGHGQLCTCPVREYLHTRARMPVS